MAENRKLSDFCGKYSLSKTLRFELRPVGETADHIEDFKNQALKQIVAQDKKRADDYQQIKKILDNYHRHFIESVLAEPILTAEDQKNAKGKVEKYGINSAFEAYVTAKNKNATKDEKKTYQTIQDNLRKIIAEEFSLRSKDFYIYKGEFSKLINKVGSGNNKTEGRLWHWLRSGLDNEEITQEEFDSACEYIANFDKFTTYFTGFNENRNNLYVKDANSTAIAYRIIHENMEKHFANCLRFVQIQGKYPELANGLSVFGENFTPPSFLNYLGQSGIDRYNETIGHKSDDINAKGVNQLINEYRQKNKLKARELPFMTVLYKQILSDRASGFIIDEFNDGKSVFEAIKAFHAEITDSDIITELQNCLAEFLILENQDSIYIKNDLSLTGISNKLWGDWSYIKQAISNCCRDKLGKTENQIETIIKQDYYPLGFVQQTLDYYCEAIDKPENQKDLLQYFNTFSQDEKLLTDIFQQAYHEAKATLELDDFDNDRRTPGKDLPDGGKGFIQIEKIKQYLDSVLAIGHFVKPLYMIKSGKMIQLEEKNTDFYDAFNALYDQLANAITLYNKVRNYVTKKPYKTDKFKINFENSTLLDGWDVNKETANTSVLLLRNGKYYLGIMPKNANNIFNYKPESSDSENKTQTKINLQQQILADIADDYFEKMVYKLLPDPSRMLPKVFFATSNIEIYNPSQEVKDIRKLGLFKKDAANPEAMHKWVDFMKESLKKHPEWNEYFNFNFLRTSQYPDVSRFYKDVADQGYCLSFDKIKTSYIEEQIASGNLYLFEIYSKDFSPYSKGRPNLHTSYWKLLFSKENLSDVVLKLNGQAEIFFRPASLKRTEVVIHPANKPVRNKNPLNAKKQSIFDYDIIKDRRFTQDKFFFHCPITINFKQGGFGKFNDGVNAYLAGNPDINMIGIDRGERHLLYYSVIDQNSNIIEQGSLNTIANSLTSNGKEVQKQTDYHSLLDDKEKQRDVARKTWSAVENIKELKAGYLSHVVHKLATLMIKHNAVVCLEDLNFGFKRGRIKVEKQVYQKFEKSLIDKLNYLVFKDKDFGQAGHYLGGYQLTAPFESFQKLGKQSGFLFYVTSDYTSKIDPVTGFVSRINSRYESVAKSQELFNKFDSISYNYQKNYFEFYLDYAKFRNGDSGKWKACTHGNQRYRYNKADMDYKCYDVTAELKTLFDKAGIDYASGNNLKDTIVNQQDKTFFSSLLFYLSLTLQLRHTYKSNGIEKDFILSPVANDEGIFFDSRQYETMNNSPLPIDADANGAYNIARKGLLTLKQINTAGKPSAIKNSEWFDFVQNK
ncbi:MAG: type V CRISPR-associated protein Cas12a/Cpf1 [Phycisphaerae bacterium]|nr:type V CRISPR-associated protein Cas12a/Cpf1 [Phycisphaerae bacterium]